MVSEVIRVAFVSRFSLFVLLSIALMIIDAQSGFLSRPRDALNIVNRGFESVIGFPGQAYSGMKHLYPDAEFKDKYNALQQENVLQTLQIQQLETLEFENKRLRDALNIKQSFSGEPIVARIKSFDLGNFNHRLLIDKGALDRVTLGQAVYSSHGMLGQVAELFDHQAVINLLSDSSHAIPVTVKRTGMRAIAYGSGVRNRLDLLYVDRYADIRYGDMLITSGLGGRFPAGYEVGEVGEVLVDAQHPFLKISARMSANVEDAKYVVLVNKEPYAHVYLP